ncbi:MAG: hypothetical protein HEP70_20205 [Rhodobiaceae bacterium]|nr:hypothetical protein [Rhodobiaceae bacterium]
MSKRRNHDAGFKARVALEALKGERAVSELAADYGVHTPRQSVWRAWNKPILCKLFPAGRRCLSLKARVRGVMIKIDDPSNDDPQQLKVFIVQHGSGISVIVATLRDIGECSPRQKRC